MFQHIKELRQYCAELRREHNRAEKVLNTADPNSKEYGQAWKLAARIDRDMHQIENCVFKYFPPE